jgi:hypothetical protein
VSYTIAKEEIVLEQDQESFSQKHISDGMYYIHLCIFGHLYFRYWLASDTRDIFYVPGYDNNCYWYCTTVDYRNKIIKKMEKIRRQRLILCVIELSCSR